MKIFKRITLITLSIIAWTVFMFYGVSNSFLLKPLTSKNTTEAFLEAAKEIIDKESVGNVGLTLIEDGKKADEYYYSIDQPVDNNTVFPVASISKWVTSFGILKLVEDGKLDLDKPIDKYLTRWNLPKSNYDNSKVTVRKLLSHSSGLIDDLGYDGFAPNETVQTIEESLTKAADAEYSEGIAIVGYEPGSQYMYSGAGYTILQLLIEEISGQSFQDFMTKTVFKPLKMNNSTFIRSEKPNIKLAQIFKEDLTIREMNTFTALAAASLYTSSADMFKFVSANFSDNPVLSKATITKMSLPETYINKTPVYGLGPHLYSQGDKKSNIIGHDGSGNNAINTAARIDLISKSGILIFETGNFSLASNLADEWLFWKAGIADYVVIQRNKTYLLTLLIMGYFIIIATSIFLIIKKNKKEN